MFDKRDYLIAFLLVVIVAAFSALIINTIDLERHPPQVIEACPQPKVKP